MNNVTMTSGWLGAGVADLARIGGPAIAMARPRPGLPAGFVDGKARRSGVQQQA